MLPVKGLLSLSKLGRCFWHPSKLLDFFDRFGPYSPRNVSVNSLVFASKSGISNKPTGIINN